jgi:hypothetical protein
VPTPDLDQVPSDHSAAGPAADAPSWTGSGPTTALPLIAPPARAMDRTWLLIGAAGAGAAVSLSLGAYGRAHRGTGEAIWTFGFDSMLPMKAWFTTAAFALALVQLVSALAMWGRLPMIASAPRWLPFAHRWAGTVAFVCTLPVAYHCLWALGFKDTGARQLVHSILGCAFYGAFTTKMLLLRVERLPRFTLPVAGGLLVSLLTGLWFTSSWWFFTNVGFPGW